MRSAGQSVGILILGMLCIHLADCPDSLSMILKRLLQRAVKEIEDLFCDSRLTKQLFPMIFLAICYE